MKRITKSLLNSIKIGQCKGYHYIQHKKFSAGYFLLQFLTLEGLILGYTVIDKYFQVFLKYRTVNLKPLIKSIRLCNLAISHNWFNLYKIRALLFKNTINIYILSTPKGYMLPTQALKKKVGGKLIIKITI